MIWKIWKKDKSNSETISQMQKKCRLKCEMIWKIWKKDKSDSEKIWGIQTKGKLNSEMIWTMQRKIVKKQGKYRRKVS